MLMRATLPFIEAQAGRKGYATQGSCVQVLARTLRVDYKLPSKPRVSADVAHLLSSLLVLDPAQRLTTAQVMQHPWFLHKLPKGVDTLNKRCLAMKVRFLWSLRG